jgi:isoquinoline 1-oxidoreductase beta subunit
LKRVMMHAAERAGWGSRPPSGRARGIAVHYTFGSYAAEVAEVSVDAKNRLRVHRVVAAVDVGIAVNPLSVEAQTQGGIIDGLSAAMFGEITVDRGRVKQATFDDYPLLRHRDAPQIDVHIVPSTEKPTGFGEIALPPLAPAVANAMFAATGRRVRRLPFVSAGFTF